MAKDDLLFSLTRAFVEDLRHAPDWAVDVDVFAGDVVFGHFLLGVGVDGTVETFTKKFKEARCEMAVLAELGVVAVDADAFLFDIHALGDGGGQMSNSRDGQRCWVWEKGDCVVTCSPTKLVYGAFGSAAKNFSHCSGFARSVKSALFSEPVETLVLDPEVTWTRMASLEPTDWTPIVTGSTMALVSTKACHCLSLSRLFWRELTDLLMACGRLCHAWLLPLVEPMLSIVLFQYGDDNGVRVDTSSQSSP